jgi:hypothetical protein
MGQNRLFNLLTKLSFNIIFKIDFNFFIYWVYSLINAANILQLDYNTKSCSKKN